MQDFAKWQSTENELYMQNKIWSKKYTMKYLHEKFAFNRNKIKALTGAAAWY